jgi:hypothetical protein
MLGLPGFKPSAAKIATKEVRNVEREISAYQRQLERKKQECGVLQRSLDINVKRGKTTLATEIATKIVSCENEIDSLKLCISNLQKPKETITKVKLLASQARAQDSALRANAAILRTVDPKTIQAMKYRAEQQADEIEMMEETFEELFEQDPEHAEKASSRVSDLIMISMEKATLENTIPSISTEIPSVLPAERNQQGPLLASAGQQPSPTPPPSYLPPSTSPPPPSDQPSPSPSSSSTFLSDFETRYKNTFG